MKRVSSPSLPRSAAPVRALQRALAILDAFSLDETHLSLSRLAAKTALPKATVFRLASTLVLESYLERVSDGYEIGLQCFRLGNIFRDGIDLRTQALPHLINLRDQTGETVQLAVLSGNSAVYLERVFSQRPVAYMRSRVGAVLPAYSTGVGKALLAFQPAEEIERFLQEAPRERFTSNTITEPDDLRAEFARIRSRGFALDSEERESGVRCIAAPIFDHMNRCVAAVSIAAPAERLPLPIEKSEYMHYVTQAGALISRTLGFPGIVSRAKASSAVNN